jgi:hypothetical protein
MVKHVFIPQSGFNIAFEHAKKIDWDHAVILLVAFN